MTTIYLLLAMTDVVRSCHEDAARTEALVDKLQTFGNLTTKNACSLEELAFEPMFYDSIFAPIEGYPEPKTLDPTVRELVRMGIRSLPTLIEHLTDKRETRFSILHEGGFGGMRHGAEYDPRNTDPKRQPQVAPGPSGGVQDKYTVTIGDVCFNAIGQIVNRHLAPIRPQPTACIVLNSPTHSPSLAAAVAKDWSALSYEEHRAQLIDDTCREGFDKYDGLKRLLYYYPKDGERFAVKLLNRRFIDVDRLFKDSEKFFTSVRPATWRRIYQRMVQTYGSEGAASVGPTLHYCNIERFDPIYVTKRQKELTPRILSAIFPGYTPYGARFYNVTYINDERDLVSALKPFASSKIDLAVQTMFRKAISRPLGPMRVQDSQVYERVDELSLHCFQRMRGKGYDQEYLAYFRKRVRQVPKPDMDHMSGSCIETMKGWLAKYSNAR